MLYALQNKSQHEICGFDGSEDVCCLLCSGVRIGSEHEHEKLVNSYKDHELASGDWREGEVLFPL
jgi:hypothetical protein